MELSSAVRRQYIYILKTKRGVGGSSDLDFDSFFPPIGGIPTLHIIDYTNIVFYWVFIPAILSTEPVRRRVCVHRAHHSVTLAATISCCTLLVHRLYSVCHLINRDTTMLETIISGALVGVIIAILIVVPTLFVAASVAIAIDMYLANKGADNDD